MKTKLISTFDDSVLICLPYSVIDKLNWKAGDYVDIDIPMTGGGLIVHKVIEQRAGDEVI